MHIVKWFLKMSVQHFVYFVGRFKNIYTINNHFTLRSEGSQNIHWLKGGVGGEVSGEQRACVQLNGLPGYMLFTCITVIYCDNSTTPTVNTALLRIWGITEGNIKEGRGQTSVGNTVRRWFLIQ